VRFIYEASKLRRVAKVSKVPADRDNGEVIDHALNLLARRGFDPTTMEQIADATGLSEHALTQHFPDKTAIVMSVVADIAVAIGAAVADIPPEVGPQDALFLADVAVIDDIARGIGVVTPERMQTLAHIVSACPALRGQAMAAAKPILAKALAERMGVEPDDPHVRLATDISAAIVAGSYNVSAHTNANNDGRIPENMTRRLRDIYVRITGARPPAPPDG